MRTVSLEEFVATVRRLGEQPRVVMSGNAATPWPLVRALDEGVESFTLHLLNAQRGVPTRAGVRLETCFIGPGMRDQPTLAYIPSRLSLLPMLFSTHLQPDVVVLHASPPRRGRVSLGIEVNVLPAAVEAVRAGGGIVVAAVNPRMPYTLGDSLLPVESVDLAVEIDEALPGATPVPADDVTRSIGALVASEVGDEATVQVGIGGVPDAALGELTARRRLRIWTEVVGDGALQLEKAGALDTSVPLSASFMLGSAELYAWADENPRLRMLRTETCNNPARIALNPGMVSVNTALEVDLFAQSNAAYVGPRPYSGFGGQPDFVAGALHSVGGKAIIALRSFHPKALRTTIVPRLAAPATSFQHSAVITENGIAPLTGRTQVEQARSLLDNLLTSEAREPLEAMLPELGLAPRSLSTP